MPLIKQPQSEYDEEEYKEDEHDEDKYDESEHNEDEYHKDIYGRDDYEEDDHDEDGHDGDECGQDKNDEEIGEAPARSSFPLDLSKVRTELAKMRRLTGSSLSICLFVSTWIVLLRAILQPVSAVPMVSISMAASVL